MRGKHKAEILVELMQNAQSSFQGKELAKECAMIAIEQFLPIIEVYEEALFPRKKPEEREFWDLVIEQIEKL